MIKLKKTQRTPNYVPDYMAKSMADVDFEQLKKTGIKYIAFDADSTLVPFRGKALIESTKKLLVSKRSMFKKWCIASNRPTNDLSPLANSIDAGVVRAGIISRKPWSRFFVRLMSFFTPDKPSEIAMIGDKLIADMWGGKRAGMVTVWVDRIGPDNPLDTVFKVRKFEKWLMRKHIPKTAKK